MSMKVLLAALVFVLSIGIGYYAFVYRPQEIKTRCLEVATYSSQGTKVWDVSVGQGKQINEEIYKRCISQ